MFVFQKNARPIVTLAGEVSVPSPNRHFKRRPVEYILYVIENGTMQLIEGDVTYILKKNDVILLDPSRTHDGIETFSDLKYRYIHFTCEELSELSGTELMENVLIENQLAEDGERVLIPKYMHLSTYEGNLVQVLSERVCKEFQEKEIYFRGRMNCLLMELLSTCARAYAGKTMEKSQRPDLTFQIIDYIRNHYQEKITGEDLERTMHLNFDYMNRSFKKKTGYTIMYYANLFRISEAKNLLRSGTCNVGDAALETGFANEFYFSRVFKKFEGISPSAYLCYIQK